MQVHFGVEAMNPEWTGSVVCIGVFDGVHWGHRQVIQAATAKASKSGLPSVLATFDRHPLAVLKPESCPLAIATLGSNLREFERLGVDVAVVLAFTQELSLQPAGRFFEEVLLAKFKAAHMVVGHDFGFGHSREGNPEWLSKRISTTVVPPMLLSGARLSSSAIRVDIEAGRVEEATAKLGRPFELEGVVIAGDRVGRTLGYPTANLALTAKQVVPADGVYAGFAHTPFGKRRAALSIGNRPTFDGVARTIEAYLLDFPDEDLYGRSVRYGFVKRLHDQIRFSDKESLKGQIERDVMEASELELANG